MEKITAVLQPKSLRFCAVLALALVYLMSTDLRTGDCLSGAAIGCNSTTVGDCLPESEEFMMESEVSRRLLVGKLKPVTRNTLNPPAKFCDREVYGSCLPSPNKIATKRVCNYRNLCDRSP